MAVNNVNAYMLDRPCWEQLAFAPYTGIAGTVQTGDGKRYIYTLFQTSTTASYFYRYDTWTDVWQQLATCTTQTGTVNAMVYTMDVGTQFNGKQYGSIYLLNGNGTTAYFYKYDIATNTWATLSIANVPATIGTDVAMIKPGHEHNNWVADFHTAARNTITTTASAAVGATSLTVSALASALASGTRLQFGTATITLSAAAVDGATTLSVNATTVGLAAGLVLTLPNGDEVTLKTAAASGATSLTVYPIERKIASGTVITVEIWATLTASAAAAATSLTVAPLYVTVPATSAYLYQEMYLIGNAATTWYRYNIGANTWYTTNVASAALAAITGAVGAGNAIKFLPAFDSDALWIVRGAGTSNIYKYSLSGNTFSTPVFYPTTETFTTGSFVGTRTTGGRNSTLLINKEATGRVYEFDPRKMTIEPSATQWLMPYSTAVVGDKGTCITSPDGIEFYYQLVHSSTGFVRTALLDS